MRILVISDTHRDLNSIVKVLKDIKNDLDAVIHLGDNVSDAEFIKRNYQLPVYYVTGNCDYEGNAPLEDVIVFGDKKFLITHGHRYSVKYDPSTIVYRALEAGADVCLYGHTHVPLLTVLRGVVVMNPGSLSLPRGGSKPSYGIIKVENGDVFPSIVEYKR